MDTMSAMNESKRPKVDLCLIYIIRQLGKAAGGLSTPKQSWTIEKQKRLMQYKANNYMARSQLLQGLQVSALLYNLVHNLY